MVKNVVIPPITSFLTSLPNSSNLNRSIFVPPLHIFIIKPYELFTGLNLKHCFIVSYF
jgi:hypothetical protein